MVTKTDGTNFSNEEVEGLKFTINGSAVQASAGQTISWSVGGKGVLYVERGDFESSIVVHMQTAGYTISAVE